MKPEEKKPIIRLLPLIFLGSALLFFFLYAEESAQKKETKPSVTHTPEYSQRVNEHLKMTAQQMKLEQLKAQNQLFPEKSKSQKNLDPVYNSQTQDPLELSSENNWEELNQRLNRSTTEATGNPTDEIHYQLFQSQQMDEYTEAYKEAYAQAFVENARKKGYEIKLSEDYRVLSVKKIKRIDRPSLFQREE